MRLFLRLTSDVNEELRSRIRYRGDISRIIDTALEEINLETVRLITETPARFHQLIAYVTHASNDRIREIANRRKCTVSALATSAIARWLSMHQGRPA